MKSNAICHLPRSQGRCFSGAEKVREPVAYLLVRGRKGPSFFIGLSSAFALFVIKRKKVFGHFIQLRGRTKERLSEG
jgi:hypothetical protein